MIIKEIDKEYLEKEIDQFTNLLIDIPKEYWTKKHFLIELKDKWKYSIVAENEGEIIGYIIASNKMDSIHIHKFMIKSTYRSKGIGKLLLKAYEKICSINRNHLITLKVYRNNERAIKFYSKNGFSIREDSEKDLLLMFKKL